MQFLKLLISVSLLGFIISCSVNPVTGERDFVLMSEDAELEMGRAYNSQVLQSYRVYDDSQIQNYVQSIGESLAKTSHRTNLIYRFTVLDSPEVNAFALPGGYIFINRGLMAYLSNEEELAAVLGHEIGHVTARHSVRQISQAQLLNIVSYAVARKAGSAAGDLTNIASGALVAGYGRDMELQADSLGAEYMVKQGYSASGDNRLKEIIKEADNLKQITRSFNSEEYLKTIEGMVYGDSEAAGVRRKDGFYHKDLDIRLISPRNWEIINTPNSLFFIAKDGEASLQVSVSDQVRKETPKEYLERLVSGDLYQSKALLLGGYQTFSALLEDSSGTARVAIVFKDKSVFTFYGSTKQNGVDINRFDSEFLAIIESFRGLNSNEAKLAKPLRIKSYRVKKGDTYRLLADKSSIPFDPEQRLRLLNGDYPSGNLKEGSLIKIVE